MGDTGLFLPVLVIFCIGVALLIGLIDEWTRPEGSYQKWLEKELERNPGYIDWLKYANCGRNYKLGLRILARIERDRSKVFYRLLKKIRG